MRTVETGVNDLKTWCMNNGEFGQQLMNEWTGEDEQGNPVEIDNVAKSSNRKVKWKCVKGHEWFTAVGNRTSHKQNCPCCYKESMVSDENSLSTWCKNHGEYGQKLAEKWVGLDEFGKTISMNEVAYASSKYVQWKNKSGKISIATVCSKTNHR